MHNINFEEINNFKIAYKREGQGEPVLMVHGITTWSFIFDEVSNQLKNKHDVISIDLLGCGNSEKAYFTDLSIKNHALLINQLIEKLNISKFHYVGHDLGGGIGQIFAVNHPEKFYDLTLINTVAYDFWPVQPIIAMKIPIIRQLAMSTLDLGSFRLIVKRGLYHKNKCNDDLMQKFWMPITTKEGRKSFLQFAHSLDNNHLLEISDKLKNLQIPTMIIRGDADVYLSDVIALKLHAELINSKLERINTAGHFLMIDEPEWLFEKLDKFFNENK